VFESAAWLLARPAVIVPSLVVAGVVSLLRVRYDWPPAIDLNQPYASSRPSSSCPSCSASRW